MDIYEIFILLGGVGMFLFGMNIMSAGLRNACGDSLQRILEKATSNRVKAVGIGAGMTFLIQSSSATDVMVIGFVNSGLMTLTQAIGVIMGANIGTTITAQITAFNLSAYAPMILFVGSVVYMFIKKPLIKHIGSIVLGFGMLFEGISFMKSAIAPLSETHQFVDFISGLDNPFITVLFGVAFTALLQSSSSSTVIFQAFAVQGIISYHTAVYLVIGAAIGSVTPNLLASLTTNRNGKRTAMLNLLFNLFRAAILMVLLAICPGIMDLIQSLSPNDVARQIANTHTIFATFAVLVMLPFSDQLVKLSQKIIPVKPEETRAREERKLHYITNLKDVPPTVAIREAKKEIERMGEIAMGNLQLALEGFMDESGENYNRVEEIEDTVNYLENAIISKLVELRASDMSQKDMATVYHLNLVVSEMERISDYAENIVEYEQQLRNSKAHMSKEARRELRELSELSIRALNMNLEMFSTEDFSRIDEAEKLEDFVDNKQDEIVANHIRRLMYADCDPVAGVVFTDMASDLERVADHAINIGCALAPDNREAKFGYEKV